MTAKPKTSTKKLQKVGRSKAAVKNQSTYQQTMQDLKTATLITSGLANLFVLIGWMVLQTTTVYNQEVVSLLFR